MNQRIVASDGEADEVNGCDDPETSLKLEFRGFHTDGEAIGRMISVTSYNCFLRKIVSWPGV